MGLQALDESVECQYCSGKYTNGRYNSCQITSRHDLLKQSKKFRVSILAMGGERIDLNEFTVCPHRDYHDDDLVDILKSETNSLVHRRRLSSS